MGNFIELSEALQSFSEAVRAAVQVLPIESIAEYLDNVERENLQLLLNIFEQQEEYEICRVIAKVLKPDTL